MKNIGTSAVINCIYHAYGEHVDRASDGDWVKRCKKLKVEGKLVRGRSKRTWIECFRGDMKKLGLKVEDAEDRLFWKNTIF